MLIKFKDREYAKLKEFCGWQIWQKPKPHNVYAMGVDVAEGVNKDASCTQIIDVTNGTHRS